MFLTAFLLTLAFPPFDLGILGLVALVPWLRELGGLTPRAAWWRGYLLGVLFFGGTVWWLVHVTVVGTLVLVAYLALYVAAFSAFAAWWCQAPSPKWCLAPLLASVWTLLEWLRGALFSGFGWNLLGHTQWRGPLLQMADLVGVYGVSWLVVVINVMIWLAWRNRGMARSVPLVTVVVVLALAVGYGAWRQAVVERAVARGPVVHVALVQGNIPQQQKWDPTYVERIKARYEELTRQAASRHVDLILWPETAVPGFADEPDVQHWVARVARDANTPLLVGAPVAGADAVFNSALLVAPDGRIVDRYDKLHLVPFGEFIPGERWWPALGRVRERLPIGQFTPGNRFTVFTVPGSQRSAVSNQRSATLSALICFEDLFPELARAFVRRGARLLVTITNDAWFGRTAAPVQHAQPSVFRAVEHRVWMLRAANTGLTCAIDPVGRLVARVRGAGGRTLWVPGVVVVPVAVGSVRPTLYTRLGDWWLGVCAAVVLSVWLRRPRWLRFLQEGDAGKSAQI